MIIYVWNTQLTRGLVVVDADPVQLQIAVSVVGPRGVNAVLIADHFPELQKQNGRRHMTVSLTKKAHICPSAMRFLESGTLNEESSNGYGVLKPDEQKGFSPPRFYKATHHFNPKEPAFVLFPIQQIQNGN